MKQSALIAGVGMTPFGKHLDRSLSSLAHEAIAAALQDAGLETGDIQAAWAGAAGAPIMTGQTLVAGQVILRAMGLGRIPVVNVENACATASTAFQQACSMVSFGAYDVVLAFGVEKLFHPEKERTFAVLGGAVDIERPEELQAYVAEGQPEEGQGRKRSLFMDIYARMARDYSTSSGATSSHYARVSAKNSLHGSLNPLAQFQDRLTEEDVLAAPMISACIGAGAVTGSPRSLRPARSIA